MRTFCIATLAALLLLAFVPGALVAAQDAAPQTAALATTALTARSGRYAVMLRVPDEGIYAKEEVELEFRLVDTSLDDPVLGPPGVIRATIDTVITMPMMPGMPKQREAAHTEGVPGEYGIHPFFPHGGDYLLTMKVSPPADEPFTVEFPLPVKDADPNRPPRPKPFTIALDAKPSKPEAGRPVELRFTVRERETGDVVKDFDIAHERIFHLLMARRDLGVFFHEHPEQERDGSFTIKHTFPVAGTYHLFADVAPRGRGSIVLMSSLEVKPSKKAADAAPFVLASQPIAQPFTVEGVRAAISSEPDALTTRSSNVLKVALVDAKTGARVTDLEPYLGAMGHMILIHEDGETFVHSHPDEADPNIGKDGVVPFLARFAKPGLYRVWAQFQRDGKVLTSAFVVRVAEGRS